VCRLGGRGLVICSHVFGQEVTNEKLVGVLVDIKEEIAFGDGLGLQYSVVAAGTSTVALLGHDVQCKQISERRAVPSLIMASYSVSAIVSRCSASRRGRQVTGGLGIVRM
jgi:hypothetical protein